MMIRQVAFAILFVSNLAPSSAEVQEPFRRMQDGAFLDEEAVYSGKGGKSKKTKKTKSYPVSIVKPTPMPPKPYPASIIKPTPTPPKPYPVPSAKPTPTPPKPYPVPSVKPTPTPPTPAPSLPPINKLCFTELAAIWWSWFLCYFDEFSTLSNTCPVQDKRVPGNTTFLFYDNQQQNCTDFKTNERTCQIPAGDWIILPVAASQTATDFVSPGNTLDTPEGLQASTNATVNLYTNITAKIDGTVTDVPRYRSQDLCSLETLDTQGCPSLDFINGWNVYSDGYWLRIGPLGSGTHTIEVSNTLDGACSGTKYIITSV